MSKRIALFNHKGGVSKTTTTFNLGWKLAENGRRVVLVDADPQCNLTGMILDYRGMSDYERFYTAEPTRNLKAGLAPAFESRPEPIQAVDCLPVAGRPNLYLLPGHLDLSNYEVALGIAHELTPSIQSLQNLPGSISFLLDQTAERFNADYVLIDMNPSLSSLNQNLLMTSDYFLLPTSPDYFSVMAVDSLSRILPRWHDWARRAGTSPILAGAAYPFPQKNPKFLGTIIQRYRPRSGQPAAAFQRWIDEIENAVIQRLIPALTANDMLLSRDTYSSQGLLPSYILSLIPDFNSLIAKSQENNTPVFALTSQQIGQVGVVLDQTLEQQRQLNDTFSGFAVRVLGLTT